MTRLPANLNALHAESADLTNRLLNCLPAATFEMEALCRLAGVRASRDIPSAAVECVYRPRLLLNPDFIAQYCKRDEHLFLLVMHELWHIILAHTRLYPRVTMAHNIAFDAIINAALSRQFVEPEYRGFFEAINPPDQFPACLLRPPVGWPTQPVYPDDLGPPGTRRLLERLYPPDNLDQYAPPLYEEILNLLRRDMLSRLAKGEAWLVDAPVLLGDHSPDSGEGGDGVDQFFNDVLKRMIGKWPAPPGILGGRSRSGMYGTWLSDISVTTEEARRAFSRVLQRALSRRTGRRERQMRAWTPGIAGVSVTPNARDRLVPARKRLGVQGLLYALPGSVRARVPDVPSKAFVYLDVSGSMAALLPHLLSLLLPYVAGAQADVYQFSTVVEPMPLSELRRGQLRSTRGTDINCVVEHLAASPPLVRRALILTDGYTGVPSADGVRLLERRAMRVHVVLPAESAWREDLERLAHSLTVLPPIRAERRRWRS